MKTLIACVALLTLGCGNFECNDDPPTAYEGVPASECWEADDGTSCCSYEFGQCYNIICSDTCWEPKGDWECGQ